MIATVTAVSRRFVVLTDDCGRDYNGRLASGELTCCVGDKVEFHPDDREQQIIEGICKRKNILKRQDANREKLLCANVDLLCILCAPPPLFNTSVINRLISAAYAVEIRIVLVFNKVDLLEEVGQAIKLINEHGLSGLETRYLSAKCGKGISEFEKYLLESKVNNIAFAGISGVGKSTLLNALIPERPARTSDLSEKTQQGRQTTSQALAYRFTQNKNCTAYIIDLPGVQQFGICHLSEEEVRASFEDISGLGESCKFADCSHQHEPGCIVLAALKDGRIAQSRFEAYSEMCKEIRAAEKY